MPLSLQLSPGSNIAVGNAYVTGQPLNSYKNQFNLNNNYSLVEEDYKIGYVQFCSYIKISLNSPSNLPWIGFAESNPRRYNLGEWAIGQAGGIVHSRGKIESTKQNLPIYSQPYPLNRNESARPKLLKLASRPRALLSNSDNVTFDYYGGVQLVPTIYSGGGTLTTPPNPFTESGIITTNGLTSLKTDIPRRQFRFDIIDGSLELQSQREAGDYYPKSSVDTNAEFFSDSVLYLFLEPGVTGSIRIETYKLGEFAFLPLVQLPNYEPGSFPSVF